MTDIANVLYPGEIFRLSNVKVIDTYTGDSADILDSVNRIEDASASPYELLKLEGYIFDFIVYRKATSGSDPVFELQACPLCPIVRQDLFVGKSFYIQIPTAGSEILKLELSALNADNNLVLDNISAEDEEYLNYLAAGICYTFIIADTEVPKPKFVSNSGGIHTEDILGFITLAEKFRFADLFANAAINDEVLDFDTYTVVNEIDTMTPVYKNLNDEYKDTDSKTFPPARDINSNIDYNSGLLRQFYDYNGLPIFRAYMDWTSLVARSLEADESNFSTQSLPASLNSYTTLGETWPIQVQIRIQFIEPRADTIQAIGSRKILRGANLQFLISSTRDIKTEGMERGRPIGELARVAQFYVDKYGVNDGVKILKDLGIKDELNLDNDILCNQFERTSLISRKRVLNKLFPSLVFSDKPFGELVTRFSSVTFLTATVTNLRFVPIDKPINRLHIPSYGLAVTIPFSFEQVK